MDRDTKAALAIGAAVTGVAAIVGGIALYASGKRRRDAQLQGVFGGPAAIELGRPAARLPPKTSVTRRGGMKTTLYEAEAMTIDERVAILQELVKRAVRDPVMIKLAREITMHCPARDGMCEAKAIAAWVKAHVRYTGDIAPHVVDVKTQKVEPIDLFSSPRRTVEVGGEDCDGHAALNSTLLILNGIESRFRITAPTKDPMADDWSHIYSLAGLPKTKPERWWALDTTLPGRSNYFGREVPFGKAKDYLA